jgi:CheY-like chemotaxis protein
MNAQLSLRYVDDPAVTVNRKPRILCVDDEPNVLESLSDTLRKRFDVTTTTNGFEALRILKEDPFEVVVSDMRMPMLNGARFLSLAREHAPDTVRLLLTGQSTLDDAVTAVNDGEVFRVMLKPCPGRELVATLDAAVTRHREHVGQREHDERSALGIAEAFMTLAAAIDPCAPERAARISANARELAEEIDPTMSLPHLEPACRLMQLGLVGLEHEAVAELSRGGQRVPREHASQLERLPELARPFLRPVPALAPVDALLGAACEPFVATVPGVAGTPLGARLLRIALDFEALECQGTPSHTSVRVMRERDRRYDHNLLDRFAELLGVTG